MPLGSGYSVEEQITGKAEQIHRFAGATADYPRIKSGSLSRKTRKYRDESTAGFSVFPALRIPGGRPRLEG
jgi:hypothetical protein